MKSAWLSALLLVPGLSHGQSDVVSDALVQGRLGVGTDAATSRLQVKMSTGGTVFQVSGVDETPFLAVASSGAIGIGVTPVSQLDVAGSGDDGSVGLGLRNGNLYPASGALQLTFGYNGKNDLRQAIATFHSTTSANNGMSFYLWSPSVSTTAVGSLNALQLVTTSTSGFVHVMPVAVDAASSSIVELVVSDGVTFGGGTVHRAQESTHSSRALKTEIQFLSPEDEDRALEEIAGLKHISFRYKVRDKRGKLVRDRHQVVRRGLAYEEAPQDVRGPGYSLSIDDRLLDAELAMKSLMRRLDADRREAGLGGKP